MPGSHGQTPLKHVTKTNTDPDPKPSDPAKAADITDAEKIAIRDLFKDLLQDQRESAKDRHKESAEDRHEGGKKPLKDVPHPGVDEFLQGFLGNRLVDVTAYFGLHCYIKQHIFKEGVAFWEACVDEKIKSEKREIKLPRRKARGPLSKAVSLISDTFRSRQPDGSAATDKFETKAGKVYGFAAASLESCNEVLKGWKDAFDHTPEVEERFQKRAQARRSDAKFLQEVEERKKGLITRPSHPDVMESLVPKKIVYVFPELVGVDRPGSRSSQSSGSSGWSVVSLPFYRSTQSDSDHRRRSSSGSGHQRISSSGSGHQRISSSGSSHPRGSSFGSRYVGHPE